MMKDIWSRVTPLLMALVVILSMVMVDSFVPSAHRFRAKTPSQFYSSVQEQAVEESIGNQDELKRKLLQLGASYDRGFGASPSARDQVDQVIQELEKCNTQEFAAEGINGGINYGPGSPLEGSWRMIWCTAQDVLILGASPLATVGAIYQVFTPPIVTNIIDFIPRAQSLFPPSLVPSSLLRAEVQTRASPRADGPNPNNRIGLSFEAVKLQPIQLLGNSVGDSVPPFAFDIPKLSAVSFFNPETGPGYFDVTFLDEELLIIRQNEPGGLFVLVKVEDNEP